MTDVNAIPTANLRFATIAKKLTQGSCDNDPITETAI